uniref:Putative membrane protein At1g06890-like n=1 Tax=Rhizophora mucronata TaxID=61149 RepID=A0A2P2K153_RHIMU
MLYSREILNFLVKKDVRKILKRKDSDAGQRGRALEDLRASLFNRFSSSEGAKRQEQRVFGPVAALTFNFLVAVGIIFINKWVFQGIGFRFPICLSFIHYAISWTLMAMLKAISLLPESPPSKQTTFTLFTLGFVMSLSTGLANVSLKYNSVGFYQMAKIAVTPSIVLAEFIWFKKIVSFPKVKLK